MVKEYPPGTVLFAGPDDDETLEQAKQYCRDNMLTPKEARISRMTITLENGWESKMISVIKK